MSSYFISDIHGCYKEFRLILKKSSFKENKDYLWIAGDLVSRGPDSLEVLRYLYALKDRVHVVLGNHDLNLIAVYAGIKEDKERNGFDRILSDKDSFKWINWLRYQSFLKIDEQKKIIISHAGINPIWNINMAKKYSSQIEKHLSSENYAVFLKNIYTNKTINNQNKENIAQLRYSINSFTRMRYCYPDGQLDMIYKESPNTIQYPLLPWFKMKNNISKEYSILFGHWSSLREISVHPPFFPLDHGCCWGGALMLLRWEDKKRFYQPCLKK